MAPLFYNVFVYCWIESRNIVQVVFVSFEFLSLELLLFIQMVGHVECG